jgi:hypothetical protein
MAATLHRHAAPFHEYAEGALAWPGEKAGAADRNEAIGGTNLDSRRRAAGRPIKQERTGLERQLAAGINKEAVDHKANLFPEAQGCIATQAGGQPSRRARCHLVAHENRRFAIERPVISVGIGEGISFYLLNRTCRGLRLPFGSPRQQQRKRGRLQ